MVVLNLLASKIKKILTQLMTVSMETAHIAKSRPQKNEFAFWSRVEGN